MRNYKTFILGGRNGSTLMIRLLLKTREFTNFDHTVGEPCKKARHTFYYKYPDIEEFFSFARQNFDLMKFPPTGFMIKQIIEKFKNPRFIVLERNVEDVIKSGIFSERNDKHTLYDDLIELEDNLSKFVVEKSGRKPENHEEAWRMWMICKNNEREKALKNYPKKFVLRIKFKDFMFDFNGIMKKICAFLNIKPMLKAWNNMRRLQYSPSRRGINFYIKRSNKYAKEKHRQMGKKEGL